MWLCGCSGKREWAIENSFLTEQQEKNREVPHSRTRLLRDFRADQSWEMQSGDMLYLPPRVPHRGKQRCCCIKVLYQSHQNLYILGVYSSPGFGCGILWIIRIILKHTTVYLLGNI